MLYVLEIDHDHPGMGCKACPPEEFSPETHKYWTQDHVPIALTCPEHQSIFSGAIPAEAPEGLDVVVQGWMRWEADRHPDCPDCQLIASGRQVPSRALESRGTVRQGDPHIEWLVEPDPDLEDRIRAGEEVSF